MESERRRIGEVLRSIQVLGVITEREIARLA
jgi:hypothetical protein